MPSIATDVTLRGLSVRPSVTLVYPAKAIGRNETPFCDGKWSRDLIKFLTYIRLTALLVLLASRDCYSKIYGSKY